MPSPGLLNAKTLAEFKRKLALGDRVRLVEKLEGFVGREDMTRSVPNPTLGMLRAVHAKKSRTLQFEMLEGEHNGKITNVDWPPASGFSCDERGFTFTDTSTPRPFSDEMSNLISLRYFITLRYEYA